MTILVIYFLLYAPEDSNTHYLMDKQLSHYFPSWDAQFDSTSDGLRTSQGCLDFWHWYINLETKLEAKFSSLLGIRYRNEYHGDYNNHVSNHYFEPFFQLRKNLRLFFTIAPHYYKGEDEVGIGLFLGKDYLNFFETFFIVDDFDRNFSFKNIPNGADKVIYKYFPLKVKTTVNKNWRTGHWILSFELTNRYWLHSTEIIEIYPPYFYERGLHRLCHSRFWQDINKLRLGLIFDMSQSEFYHLDTNQAHREDLFEIIFEPMIAYRINEKWIPMLYLIYNYKTDYDSLFLFGTTDENVVDYKRDIYAYLIDIEFHPGGNFVWHIGMQQQFYKNNQEEDFKERRFTLGCEYHYKNVWFYVVEAMEGDFPMPHWLHNRTYVQLMLRF